MKRYLNFIIFFSLTNTLISQISFSDKSNQILNNDKIYSSMCISVADINGDYYDDFAILDKGIYLKLYYNSGNLKNYSKDSIGQVFSKEAWTINTGDINNDGISEIYICGAQTYGNIYTKENGHYTLIDELRGVSYAQNSNFADINNDGYLDLFVCNENNYNAIYLNDKKGKLVWNDFIDFKIDSNYNNNGDYGSDFVDFDDDGDIDLFITKCWSQAEKPNDPRRVNTLFENDGNNNYLERAKDWGLNSGAQSWTGMFGDMDNDGDMDCFVSNHDTFHYYYENILNDTFIIQTAISFPELFSNSIQASLRDFDNNGYLDILISGDKSYLIWNFGNNSFVVEKKPFDRGEVHSFGIGDLNNDGFLDIYACYGSGLNKPSNYKDLIWINEGNENNWIKFSLLGQSSNRQGIGTKIKIYGPWGIQTRDCRIGESYGITNSINLNFGLAKWSKIDSVLIKWPSGITDKYYDVKANIHYLAQEGMGLNPFFDIETIGNRKFCSGDSVILIAPYSENYSYLWSTGESTNQITIKNSGAFNVTITDIFGVKHISKLITTELNPVEQPELEIPKGNLANCKGDTVIISSQNNFNSYLWSSGDTTKEVSLTKSGMYFLKVKGTCNMLTSDTLNIEFIETKDPILPIQKDTIHTKQRVKLLAAGKNILWYGSPYSNNPVYSGNIFLTDTIDRDTSFWVESKTHYDYPPKYIGIKENIQNFYGDLNTNGGLIFDCFEDIILKSVTVFSGKKGVRRFQIKDNLDSILVFKDIFIDKGASKVELYFHIPSGKNYKLETDKLININVLGTKSPDFYRDLGKNVNFPYENDLMSIKTSYFGPNYYYYFYNWEVSEEGFDCTSNRLKLKIIYDPQTSIRDLNINKVYSVFPNPTSDYLFIDNHTSDYLNIDILDSFGNFILTSNGNNLLFKLQINNLKQGIYFIKISTNQNSYITKFIKI